MTRGRLGAVILGGILAVDFLAFATAIPSPVLDRAPTPGPASALARPVVSPDPSADLFAIASPTFATTDAPTPTRAPEHSATRAAAIPARAGATAPAARLSARTRVAAAAIPYAVWSGRASWYNDGPGLYAAVPGWRHVRFAVIVRRSSATRCNVTAATPIDRKNGCVRVIVRDWCGCYVGTRNARAIDLSPAAFAVIAPLSRGIATVTLSGPRTR